MSNRWFASGLVVGLLVALAILRFSTPDQTRDAVPKPQHAALDVVDASAMCAFRPTLEGRLPPELEALGEAWPPHEEEWLRVVEEGAEGR